jgi:uncharacterized protein (DUF1800 family)
VPYPPRALARSILLGLWAALLFLPACSGGGGGGSGGSGGTNEAAIELETHAQDRVAFGPDTWTADRVRALGLDAFLDEQLAPASIDDSALETRLAADYTTLDLTYAELYALLGTPGRQPISDLIEARLLRSVLTHRQLEQALVDFWFNHFNVFGIDGFNNFVLNSYERDAIRPHVLGRFEDMLVAVARHPSMLFYLDNYLNAKEGFVFQGQVRGLNENYARELLELHTVGVDGGYTQPDVVAVARAFTGWTIGDGTSFGDPNGFFFWAAAHDDDAKTIMQDLYLPPGGGMQDGLDVLAFLAAHPSTANFLCTKLVRRFVDEDAPEGLVSACSTTYLASDGDLAEVMRTLLFSPEFRSEDHRGRKVKRPVHYIASLIRATEFDLTRDLAEILIGVPGVLGEPMFLAAPPTGFPDASSHWASGGTLVQRFNYARDVVGADLGIDWGVTSGTTDEIVDGVADRIRLGLEAATRADVIRYVDGLGNIPDDQRVREAAAALLASPDFLRH